VAQASLDQRRSEFLIFQHEAGTVTPDNGPIPLVPSLVSNKKYGKIFSSVSVVLGDWKFGRVSPLSSREKDPDAHLKIPVPE